MEPNAVPWPTSNRPALINMIIAVGVVILFAVAWSLLGPSTAMENAHKEWVAEAGGEDNGRAFEEWVVTRLSETHVLKRAHDNQASHPGVLSGNRLEAALTLGGHAYPFSMECMWRNSLMGANSALGNGQLQRYRRHTSEDGAPVFVILGIGGNPAGPAMLYIVPASELPGDKLTMEYLAHYRQPMTSTLFYFEPFGQKLSY